MRRGDIVQVVGEPGRFEVIQWVGDTFALKPIRKIHPERTQVGDSTVSGKTEPIQGDVQLVSAAPEEPGQSGPATTTGEPEPLMRQTLPNDSAARKRLPVVSGMLDYFPDACVAVAAVSVYGNDKHNPGEPLHHARGKSMDHADAIGRHLLDRGEYDEDTGLLHDAELAWRAMANLQQTLEDLGLADLPRGAKND